MRKGPVFSMGKGGRGEEDKVKQNKFVPGAGSYSPNPTYTQKKGPRFGFGSSKRPDPAPKTLSPGPGAYKLPIRIADVHGH